MKEFIREQISAVAALVESNRFLTGQANRELHRHWKMQIYETGAW
jgi:hypothetical protein